MSQYNHLNDPITNTTVCEECGKKFEYSVDDISMYGGHDSAIIRCPWCGKNNGEVYGGDSITVYTNKID